MKREKVVLLLSLISKSKIVSLKGKEYTTGIVSTICVLKTIQRPRLQLCHCLQYFTKLWNIDCKNENTKIKT